MAQAARVAHAGLLITPAGFFVLALVLLRADRGVGQVDPGVLRWGALALGAVLVAITALLRNTLPPRASGQAEDAWWQAHLPRAVILWSMAEMVGVAGVVLSIVAGDIAGALPLVVASTLLLLHLAPGRLAGS